MRWKKFFEPTILKVIFTILLLAFSFFLSVKIWQCILAPCSQGLPLGFYDPSACGACIGCGCKVKINYLMFVADIVIWYLILCVLFYIFARFKKEERRKK